MNNGRAKVVGIVIEIPVDLALQIIRESGNLTISEYPAIEGLAECIAETLDIENLESKIESRPILVLEQTAKHH